MLREDRVKGLAHGPLRCGESRPDGVGTVAEERQDPFLAQLGKPLQIKGVAEYRGIVYLKVAGVDDHARRGKDRQGRRVGDAVVDLDELYPEAAQIDRLAMLHHLALGALHQVVFFQLVLDQSDGQLGAVHRNVDLLQDVRQGADVVLVSVGDHKALHLIDVPFQISHVRDHQVDAQHVVGGERQAAVYYDDGILILKGRDVHTDLLQTAQRDDLHLGLLSVPLWSLRRSLCTALSPSSAGLRPPLGRTA